MFSPHCGSSCVRGSASHAFPCNQPRSARQRVPNRGFALLQKGLTVGAVGTAISARRFRERRWKGHLFERTLRHEHIEGQVSRGEPLTDEEQRGASLIAIDGTELRLLALRRGVHAGDDALLVERADGCDAEANAPIALSRVPEGGWSVGEPDGLVVDVCDAELIARSRRRHSDKPLDTLAPDWPKRVAKAMGSWPMKGRGTIVFDAGYFWRVAAELLRPENGPVLLVDAVGGLDLASKSVIEELRPVFEARDDLVSYFAAGQRRRDDRICYGDLLASSEAVRSGRVDLSSCSTCAESSRIARLEEWPFGFLWGPRSEVHGAVMRDLEPEGTAELAGCRLGDVIVSACDHDLTNAPLGEVSDALNRVDEEGRLTLQITTPIMDGPFYLREASTAVIQELLSAEAESRTLEIIPELRKLLGEHGGLGLEAVQHQPKVFAGDPGSASRIHIDTEPRVQFCHVLHGVKLFAVEADSSLAAPFDVGEHEVSCPASGALDDRARDWLCSPGVTATALQPGDILLFWGGCRHSGTNAASVGPCISLFHGFTRTEL